MNSDGTGPQGADAIGATKYLNVSRFSLSSANLSILTDRFCSSTITFELLQNLLIVAFAAITCYRCLISGITEANDAHIHALYQHYFSQQFWNGDLYPRWLAEDNKGYGNPIFLIQYPLPYFITALLRPITSFPNTDTREARELGVYCFLVFAAAGLAARAWFRNRCSPIASTVAAAIYIALPYVMGQDDLTPISHPAITRVRS